MHQPAFLKPGDRIRIVSPAGKIDAEKVMPAVELLKQEGFEVLLGQHTFDRHFQFAGTDADRLNDFQEALDDPDCRAIICSRGGYGAIRLVDELNFERFRRSPKWLVGFSDITVLHARFQQEGFCSIHGPMTAFYLKDGVQTESYRKLMQMVRGNFSTDTFDAHQLNRGGHAEGELCGGNLSIVYSLLGTALAPDTAGKILFIEDLTEYLYHLDRMMHGLKMAGKLKDLSALLVGSFTEMKDNDSPFGQSVEEIIFEAVRDYDFPVYFDCPSGHIDENMPLLFGGQYSLTAQNGQVILTPKSM
ncbi:S66 peptidase family protein [Mangrovibacterium diazotrophicum]|uniref:Muramoyltetrapeptide carboxypeptidase n=1 Tax=Mangrovibacterium diazotrophicum TaxID=1261403 RepID=A0A419WA34_9BACT|nr:LD-carboxypeptidase [Mangrovibacterium diazotrophicum]RKD92340.1 muramoyltetrapeptide carboxypeptidase [Mangrovibacterium diazotrophicum]